MVYERAVHQKSVQNYRLRGRNHTKNQTKVDKERGKATLSANQRKRGSFIIERAKPTMR